jgi:hypothetical protein
MAFDPGQFFELRYNTFEHSEDGFQLREEGIRIVVRILVSSLTDPHCVVQLVDGEGRDRNCPFAAKITRLGALRRLQACGKTILSTLGALGEGVGNEAGYLQPQPALIPAGGAEQQESEYAQRTRQEAGALAGRYRFNSNQAKQAFIEEKVRLSEQRAIRGLLYESPKWTSIDSLLTLF